MSTNDKNQSNAKLHIPRNFGFEATTNSDFYFVSYNSNDCDRISPYAQQIHDAGIPLWYDKGLIYGEKWEEEIGIRIAKSKAFILFFTKGILEKKESYAEMEFRIAKRQQKTTYIVMVDNLDDDYWKKYPRKSAFLDAVSQTHSCSCERIDYIIDKLKSEFEGGWLEATQTKDLPAVNGLPMENVLLTTNNASSSGLQSTKDLFSSKVKEKALPFTEPTIVDSETLLNGGYFTAKELSQRHVELDFLTVDGNLFPDALEIEGDADTWENMVLNTADCTGNLIINNKIVGYMDFVPVTPENFDLLRTQPFTDEYVAFYSFGGNFDIYVSMFSIDKNYAFPNNYKLFFQWIISRILDLRDSGVYINRIGFSIYSNSQAAALQSLGCKLVLKSKLKGFLYETRAKDLLNNKLLQNNIIKGRISTYDTYTSRNEGIIRECERIAEPLLYKNGGILHYEDAPSEADVIITARVQEKTVGYVCLKEYDVFPGDIYIEQIAVEEKYQGFGIGENLLKNAIIYATERGYGKMYANCRKINLPSQSLLRKAGFEDFDMTKEQYLGIEIKVDDIDKNYAFVYTLK